MVSACCPLLFTREHLSVINVLRDEPKSPLPNLGVIRSMTLQNRWGGSANVDLSQMRVVFGTPGQTFK